MINITFTKGVGTPTYMAPDVVGKSKNAADVFLYAVMLFECLKCCLPDPKAQFMYPWLITVFVGKGSGLIVRT